MLGGQEMLIGYRGHKKIIVRKVDEAHTHLQPWLSVAAAGWACKCAQGRQQASINAWSGAQWGPSRPRAQAMRMHKPSAFRTLASSWLVAPPSYSSSTTGRAEG